MARILTLYCALNMQLGQVSLTGVSGSMIGHLSVTFSGAPNFDVDDGFDGAYFK